MWEKKKIFLTMILSVLLVMSHGVRAFAADDHSNGMTVETSLNEQKLTVTVTGIKQTDEAQLLTYSLMTGDGKIIYSNARYVNGEESISECFPVGETDLKDCVLTVNNGEGTQIDVITFAEEAGNDNQEGNQDNKEKQNTYVGTYEPAKGENKSALGNDTGDYSDIFMVGMTLVLTAGGFFALAKCKKEGHHE